MWKLVVIRLDGVTIIDDTEVATRFAYRASQESTLTLFAFLYDNTGALVESLIPTVKRRRNGTPV